ncbi:c2 domain-containing protein [Cyclospora cayetanensis]|uniref:C2 domain-containing protein n=1 Tax=Cyclospora cayetanensis TaxID=88456 RepID=A0A1D3D8D9_9EIME|nr:c2 domain-containing protein [Cyclospora cayetanensis]
MLAGLKDMIPGQQKPPPASQTPAAGPPGGGAPPEQQEALNPEVGDTPVPEGEEPLDAAEVEKMLFDEYLGAAEYTYEEFLEALQQPLEEKGETEDEKKHWQHPRRWKVVLWNLSILNYMSDQLAVFVEIEFGGSREECKVLRGDSTRIYAKGEDKNYLRTSVVNNVNDKAPVDLQFRQSFEYRGSYLDLEREKLKIKVWEYKTWTLNNLEAVFEEPLLSFATGETHVERDLYKFVKGRRSRRCRITCQLYFQELYDFELAFIKWRLSRLCSSAILQHRVFNRGGAPSGIHSRGITRASLAGSMEGAPRKGISGAASVILAARKSVASHMVSRLTSRPIRNLLPKESTMRTLESGAEETQDAYTNLLLQHMQTLVLADQDVEGEVILSLDPLDSATGRGVQKTEKPDPRLRISLMHSSTLNSGVKLVTTEQEATNAPFWDNMGEVYFRGTLRDLDTTYLEVIVEDMSASTSFRQIGYGQLPLRGVVGYPSLQMELGPPNWVVLQAKVEGWGDQLKEWQFGWLEGRVMIAHTPRYRQVGEVYEVDANRVYLIVKVISIDQIITADNRSSVDSYVEVSFDGTSRRTRLFRNSLNPVWEDEVTVPLRFASTRDISYSEIQKKGKVYLDVWGVGPNYVDHLGGCTFYLHDIFFNEKNQKKSHVTKERIILETNLKTKYETRVYTGGKRLSFIHKDDRPSNLTFEAWTCPDLLEASGLDRLPKSERFDTKNNMPRALAERYDQLKAIFQSVADTKMLLSPEAVVGPPRFFDLERLDQRKEFQFLPSLLAPIKPPLGVDSLAAVFHYVRCVPFVIKRQALTFSPDFTMQLNAGDPLDHCLLMTSLLLGLPAHAFVCIGTLHDKHMHAWVATFHWDEDKEAGHVKLWETASGVVYVLKTRFQDNKVAQAVITDPESGMISVASNQRRHRLLLVSPELAEDTSSTENGSLDHMRSDEKRREMELEIGEPRGDRERCISTRYWYQFCPGAFLITPCFIPKGFGTKISELQFEKAANELLEKVMADLTAFRASRNLNTKWNRDEVLEAFLQTSTYPGPRAFDSYCPLPRSMWIYRNVMMPSSMRVQPGLELLHQANTAREEDFQLAKLKLEDWRKALYSKVPNSYRVRGAPLHYNTMDCKSISDSMIRQVEFLESRDRSASFAMAACLYNLPGELCSTYIYLLLCQKVTERERRKILAAKEQVTHHQQLSSRWLYDFSVWCIEDKSRSGDLDENDNRDPGADQNGHNDDPSPAAEEDQDPLNEDAAQEENNMDGAVLMGGKKKKKRKKGQNKTPKVKKRPPNLSPESEVAYFEIHRNYYDEDEAPDFKALMQDLEDSGRYYEKRLVFAIHPDTSLDKTIAGEKEPVDGEEEISQPAGALSPAFLMDALKELTGQMIANNEVFSEITGGEAKFVWEGHGTRPFCKEGQGGAAQSNEPEEAPDDGTSAALNPKKEPEKLKKKKKKKKPAEEEIGAPTEEEPAGPTDSPIQAATALAAPAAIAEAATAAAGADQAFSRSSGSSESSEPLPPPPPPQAERRLRERLHELEQLRDQLHQETTIETDSESLSISLSSTPYFSTLKGNNAELQYISSGDEGTYSDSEAENEINTKLMEQLNKLDEEKQNMDNLLATIQQTGQQLADAGKPLHRTELELSASVISCSSSTRSFSTFLPSPPPFLPRPAVSKLPQPPAADDYDNSSHPVEASHEGSAYMKSVYAPLLQQRDQIPWWLGRKLYRKRKPSPSTERDTPREKCSLRGNTERETPQSAFEGRREPFQEPIQSTEDAAAVLRSQQESLRTQVRQQEQFLQHQQLYLQNEKKWTHVKRAYTAKPPGFAYKRLKETMNVEKTRDGWGSPDLMKGFICTSSSDSGESEY